MKKIFLFILFCLSVCSMSAYDFLRAVKDEIPEGYNFWVYTPVDYFYYLCIITRHIINIEL